MNSAYATCPVTFEKADHNVVRATALLTIAMLAAFAATGWVALAALLAADCTLRAWTDRVSPMQQLGHRIARAAGIPALLQDKAPKKFAARIGWAFAVTALGLSFVSPAAGVVVGLSLLGFNVLDAVLGFCVGCWTYTYLVMPLQARIDARTAGRALR